MKLKGRIIEEIEQFSRTGLIALQDLLSALKVRRSATTKAMARAASNRTKQALSLCHGNLSDVIIQNREDRLLNCFGCRSDTERWN